jgi:hypothetical protein
MPALKLKKGLGPLYLSAHTIEGLEQDRFFTDSQMEFDDFTEAEAKALLSSFRGGDFERTDATLYQVSKEELQAKYTALLGKEPSKHLSEAKLIAAIEDAEVGIIDLEKPPVATV